MPFSFVSLISASSLATLAAASILPNPNVFNPLKNRLAKRDVWTYGVVGDSWGSGVSYNDDVLLDGNLDNCLRTKESHGPQLDADTSWLGGFQSGLRDAACSGSQFVDLALGAHQMGKVGNPNLIIMTSGGNNAGFGNIVRACIYHSEPSHDYGKAYKDDTDGTGDCAVALNGATNYIQNTMGQDLINTINDMLNDPAVKNNPDFRLYLTGYAQFFGTDLDSWCNNEAWNLLSLVQTPTPYLSVELRKAFNDRVSAVNSLYKNTVASNFADKVRYIDIDAGFSGHRFCEPGATRDMQFNTDTNFDGVYLWNLNWFVNNVYKDPKDVTTQEAQDIVQGQGVTAWSGSGGGSGGGISNTPWWGFALRPFHPRTTGYTSIKNAILSQLKTDGLPKAASGSASPQPTPPAFVPGTCSFHLDEWQSCEDDTKNLYAQIKMYDNDKIVIGQTEADSTKPLGDSINANDPLNFQSKLPFPLQVTGEHKKDYVQFNYNGLSFKSTDGQCSAGGWDPKQGPTCGLRTGNKNARSAEHSTNTIRFADERTIQGLIGPAKPWRTQSTAE
ncbi:MAG: hypothetical protein Q9186_007243 [Xanthomendoza sp. 1 TL-2023]